MTVVKKVFIETQSLYVAVPLQIQTDILNADYAFQLPASESSSGD